MYYDRRGAPMTLQQRAQKLQDEDYRHIARDVIGPKEPLDPGPLITVSTFWLGVNHDWRSEEPLIYETSSSAASTTRPVCGTRQKARREKATGAWSTRCGPSGSTVRAPRRPRPRQQLPP
jgi:hypothetical protein